VLSDDVRALYQEMILDHGRSPRHFGELVPVDRVIEGINPVCGDVVKLYLNVQPNQTIQAQFTGHGCAISMAATSLLLELIQGQSVEDALHLIDQYRQMVKGELTVIPDVLGKLVSLSGVKGYPSRIKCATLGCHALKAVLSDQATQQVSTETED
jgi:nitrogen fixation protein NifU and related proteins